MTILGKNISVKYLSFNLGVILEIMEDNRFRTHTGAGHQGALELLQIHFSVKSLKLAQTRMKTWFQSQTTVRQKFKYKKCSWKRRQN